MKTVEDGGRVEEGEWGTYVRELFIDDGRVG